MPPNEKKKITGRFLKELAWVHRGDEKQRLKAEGPGVIVLDEWLRRKSHNSGDPATHFKGSPNSVSSNLFQGIIDSSQYSGDNEHEVPKAGTKKIQIQTCEWPNKMETLSFASILASVWLVLPESKPIIPFHHRRNAGRIYCPWKF